MLLLGAGLGEATCGILYLAGYLRRHGIEAHVRLHDGDEDEAAMVDSLTRLLSHLRPKAVGLSLKWFNHVSRALVMARAIRRIAPEVRIVVGGDSASYFWRELGRLDCFDDILLGDGEAPLLSLCRGEAEGPNRVTWSPNGTPDRVPLAYVQNKASTDVHYSHFDDVFLSQLDQSSFSGWVAPGKGCGENCVYCAGGRGMQQGSFGRADSFLRPVEAVHRDHREIAGRTWQLRYDFSGGTAPFLGKAWQGVDLTAHSTTYFLWGVPPPSLIEALSATFKRVYLVLDVGCFSAAQRLDLMRRGLLKPCPTDRELLATVEACKRFDNLKLEVCGIAGLPFTSERALAQEGALVERLLDLGCDVGSQRLEAQPGALVTQHPDRFDMVSDAKTFDEFVAWFSERGHLTNGAFPMVTFRDAKVERAVQRAADQVQALIARHAPAAVEPTLHDSTRLVTSLASRGETTLGQWLGPHVAPEGLFDEPVTLFRTVDGAGLACSTTLSERRFTDPSVQQGTTAKAIVATLEAFKTPVALSTGVHQVVKRAKVAAAEAESVVHELVAGRFVRPS